MAKTNPEMLKCHLRTGPSEGLLCENCEGRCPICDSPVDNGEVVKICGNCSFGQLKDRCIVCGAPAKHVAYYCQNCVLLGKNRDGCPRIINVGLSRSDMYFEKRRSISIPENIESK